MSKHVLYEGVIRAKWSMEGAPTLEEAVSKLRMFARELEQMSKDGITLCRPIHDDYGFVCTTDPVVAEKHGLLLQSSKHKDGDE